VFEHLMPQKYGFHSQEKEKALPTEDVLRF
jgi:hypothetical protein